MAHEHAHARHAHAGHSHGHHAHQHAAGANKKALWVVLALTGTFMFAEVIGGLLTGSLALLADAAHMLSDNVALGLALFAFWLSAKPPTPNRSFGYKRAEILVALFNGMTIVAISIWIFYEAFRRLGEPPEILGGWMMVVAILGLMVNAAGAIILYRSAGENLNMQGALRHVIADLLGSMGVIAAALIILLTGWSIADPIISALIGALILASSYKLLKDSVSVLLENAPAEIDAGRLGTEMAAMHGVQEVHDLHIWTVTSGFPALAAHVLVGADEDCHDRRRELEVMIAEKHGIEHTTLQVDHVVDNMAVGDLPRFNPEQRQSRQ